MTVIIRPGGMADLPAVGVLHAHTRRTAYAGILPPGALAEITAERQYRGWADRIPAEAATHRLLVAELSATSRRDSIPHLLGFAYLGADASEDDHGWLYAVHVHPGWHGTGLAQALLAEAVATLRALGHQKLALWVIDGNARAQAFYTKSGWTHDGVRRSSKIGTAETTQLRYVRT